MAIKVSCQGCGKAYSVPDERAGQRFKCKACGTAVSVPADEWGFGGDEAAIGGSEDFVDPGNPYAASAGLGRGRVSSGRANALSKTRVCSIFLFVITGFSVIHHLFVGVSTIILLNANPQIANQPQLNEQQQAMETARFIGGITGGTVGIVMDILVIVGAYNLLNLKSRSWAMTGAIIACIPCCGPCIIIGIPFGIWALTLINNPEIKPHFQ